MDKRFLLFLVLAAIILIVTPKLFPPARPRHPAQSAVDSLRTLAAETNRTAVPVPPAAAPAPPPVATATPTPVSVTAAKADTITVATPTVVYQFSTVGAMPIGARLPAYKVLSKHDGQVELARPGVPLVEYELLQGTDTLHLDQTAFAVDSSALRRATSPALTFRDTVRGTDVAITYTFSPDSYLVRVRGTVRAPAAKPLYLLTVLPDGLQVTESDTVDDERHLAYAFKPTHDDAQSVSFGKLNTPELHTENGPLTWVASRSKFFVVGLLTDSTGTPFSGALLQGLPHPTKLVGSATMIAVQPIGANGQFGFDLYSGPQEWRRLLALGRDFEHVNPYGGFFRPIVQPFGTIVMRILLWMHAHLKINYGWIIIIFGVAIRVILWPLNQSAMRSSLRMQRLQPELQAIQRKYKNNQEKLQAEMMRLYKEHGMSPFSPVLGCLPMLIPWPVLVALYYVFQSTIEFRGVSFLWMADISQKDPYYILPIVMGVSMFVLSWIGLRSSPPNSQAKMMAYAMPLVMTLFFLNLAAGLNLYYAVQNIAALPQQWLIARERAKVAPPRPPAPVRAG